MSESAIQKIKEIYANFKIKLDAITSRKKLLLKAYRSKLEEEKIKNLKENLNK